MKSLYSKYQPALLVVIMAFVLFGGSDVFAQGVKPTPKPTVAVNPSPTPSPIVSPTPSPSPTPLVQPSIPVWKTIKFGGKGSADLLKLLEKFYVSDSAKEWINTKLGDSTASPEAEINLFLVTGKQLGLSGDATRKDVDQAALKRDLRICSAIVGPQLRYQYTDQLVGEQIFIAMDSFTYQDARARVFTLDRTSSGSWLYTYYGFLGPGKSTEDVWGSDSKWVYCRPKPVTPILK